MVQPRPRPQAHDAILDRLTALHPKAIDLSLGRIRRLMRALGHPERRLPPVVHVAGTNGKGSVIAFLRAILEAAGFKVHAYTSPHLVHFNERIRLAGGLIEDAYLRDCLLACEDANAGEPITFFEITTAAAFLAFAEVPADIVLLETGLGGRLDATNICEKPRLTALTPISLDHMHYLGASVAEIAAEKAGILKPGVSCVVGPEPMDALAVIEAKAQEKAVRLSRAGREWRTISQRGGFLWENAALKTELLCPLPGLPGLHQIDNAGLALACLAELGEFEVAEAAMRQGLKEAVWPARLQRLTQGPLLAEAPSAAEVWLDGGHNPAAGEALARTLEFWHASDPRPLFLIVGMLQSKDGAGFLKPFAGLAQTAFTLAIPGNDACFSAAELAQAAAQDGIRSHAVASPTEAMRRIRQETGGQRPRILITGSLFLAGAILAENG
jgi:dihydrofolate synthase/folylpolyglutamate synthase